MPSLAIIGAQWGDEGKGKLVDYLTDKADYVVRFQGGNNAGHTLVVDGVKTKLSLVPSGILRPDSKCLLGTGVVVNPDVLLDEISELKKSKVTVTPERLVIDRDAHLILDYHLALDSAREKQRGDNKIGTTKRGIGPAYQDRAERCGVRFAELLSLESLKSKLEGNVDRKNKYLSKVLDSENTVDFAEQWEKIERYASALGPFIGNVSLELNNALEHDKRIVFEGAQGTLLDQYYGTVPFVTSSNTISGAVTVGAGIGPKHIDYVLGVAKAYVTRVGSGPFPTELDDASAELIRNQGEEYGTVTGRARRCGWFDAVAMKRAQRLNGFDSVAVTKLDVLSGVEEIKICIKYQLDGAEIEDMPALAEELDRVEPVYITLNGWEEDISQVRKWYNLPANARLFLSTISEILGCPVSMVSVGAERECTIFSSSASFVRNFVE